MKSIQKQAEKFSNMFEYITEEKAKEIKIRANIYLLKDEHANNEELKDLIRKAHGDKLPDDYCYEFIVEALDKIAECQEGAREYDIIDAIYEIEADVYTSNLTSWLNSRADRVRYLTEALEECEIKDGFQALAVAQQKEKQEVALSVLKSLKEICK